MVADRLALGEVGAHQALLRGGLVARARRRGGSAGGRRTCCRRACGRGGTRAPPRAAQLGHRARASPRRARGSSRTWRPAAPRPCPPARARRSGSSSNARHITSTSSRCSKRSSAARSAACRCSTTGTRRRTRSPSERHRNSAVRRVELRAFGVRTIEHPPARPVRLHRRRRHRAQPLRAAGAARAAERRRDRRAAAPARDRARADASPSRSRSSGWRPSSTASGSATRPCATSRSSRCSCSGSPSRVPAFGDRLEAPLSRLARFGPQGVGHGFWSGILVGAALGFVYAPCAGPVLAAVVSVGAASGRTVSVGLAYALGSRRRAARARARRPRADRPRSRAGRRCSACSAA